MYILRDLTLGLGQGRPQPSQEEDSTRLFQTFPSRNAAESVPNRSPIVCAVRGCGQTLKFAIEKAKGMDQPLYILFVREQPILSLEDFNRDWRDDHEARCIFEYAKEKGCGHPFLPCYVVSDSTATTIVEFAAKVGASRLVLGASRRNMLLHLIRGDLTRRIYRALPETIKLIVYASDVI